MSSAGGAERFEHSAPASDKADKVEQRATMQKLTFVTKIRFYECIFHKRTCLTETEALQNVSLMTKIKDKQPFQALII